MTVVEAKFGFFQMEQELVAADAIELLHPAFSEGPEALDTVDVVGASGELTVGVIDPKMFRVPDIDEAAVTAPRVRVDDGVQCDAAPYNGLQSAFAAIGDDLRVDAPVAFEDPEHDGFPAGPATAFAWDSSPPEVGLVDLDLPRSNRAVTNTFFKQSESYFLKDQVDAFACHSGQHGGLFRRKIHRETPQYLAKFPFRNSGTPVIAV